MRSLSMPFLLIGLLAIGLTCAQRPANETDATQNELLRGACERALSSLAPEAEPTARVVAALPPALGPALRALRGTGRGPRVSALESALDRAGRHALADTSPWLTDAAARFTAEDPAAAATAFRDATEAGLRAELAAAVERALGPAGAADALAAIRDDARRLPLPREIELDPVSYVTEQTLDRFFGALSDEEQRLRQERTLVHDGREQEDSR